MSERKKILQVIGYTELGGVASCMTNYMKHCSLDRYRFDFVTYTPSVFDEKIKRIDGEAVIYHIPRFDKKPLKAMSAMDKICRGENYAAVHSHMSILSALVLPPAASAKIPVRICHAHSTFNKNSDRYLIKKFMRPFAASCATNLMACSRTAAEIIFKKHAGEADILHNAIEAERFYCTPKQHEEAKKQCGLTKTTALFTGRFVYQKNLNFLIEAFAAAKRDDMELVLLGEGAQYGELKKLCAEYGIENKVKFIPAGSTDIWYKAADVFCLPSHYEGLSISAVEAQAAGLPCLFSENVSKETDVTGQCSFIKTDKDVWAKALNGDFKRNYNVQNKIIESGYDIKYEADKLIEYYDHILQGTPRE